MALTQALNWHNNFLIYYEVIYPFSWQRYNNMCYICPWKSSVSWVSSFHGAPNLIGFEVLSLTEISSDLGLKVYRIAPSCFHSSPLSSIHMLYTLQNKHFHTLFMIFLMLCLPSVHI